MPQRLLLEGPDIDALLMRVQTEHGPAATIVHAEQKLVGGVAGFFARRRYELAVQVDDDVPSAISPAAAAPAVEEPSSFEDLLESADGADGGLGPTTPRTPEPSVVGDVPVQRGRRLSTESPQFEDLLSSLIGRAERDPAAVTTPVPDTSFTPTSFTGATTVQPGQRKPLDVPQGADADEQTLDIGRALSRTVPLGRTTAWDRVVIGGADATAPAAADPRPPSQPPVLATEPATSHGAVTGALAALGLPAAAMPQHPVADVRAALLDVLAQLPAPALGRLWGTTVVVGPADLAHRTAATVLEHTGGAGSPALVATSDSPSAADLAVRASAFCSTDGAAVVVIETPATRAAARRAGRLVAGLGLGTVIAAVDATRDVTATGEWLAELGGAGRHVDQLAAFDVAESPSPLALLGLGPQVGWVDGRPASIGTWAAPCLDRMHADGRPR
jgi:hypothetical protein